MFFQYKKSIGAATAAFISVGIMAMILSPAGSPQAQKEKPAENAKAVPKAEYIGSETCQACHEDPPKQLIGSVHHSLLKEGKKPDGTGGCESCHGPGSIHAEDPKKENILTFKIEPAAARSNACLSCHGKKVNLADFRRSAHRTQRIPCDQCHANGSGEAFHRMRSVEEMKKTTGSQLCVECHGEVRSAFSMPFHHRVNEGYMRCVDCHREHGGFRIGRKGNELNNETCGRCHPEKEGPFVFEHVPSRVGGCLSCHSPHGSTNPKMLVRSTVRLLCLECHTNTPPSHNTALERYQNCTACHTSIHGSNHSPAFFE